MSPDNFTVTFADLSPSARIRETALRLFAEHGTKATSIRMVAEAAGVSPGAVMHHFGTKEELERAVQHTVVERVRQAIAGVGLDEPPGVATRMRRDAFDRFILTNPYVADYIRQVHLEGGTAGVELFSEMTGLVRSEMHAMVDAGLARPMPDEDVGLVLYRVLSAAHVFFRPLIEQTLGVDLSDPATVERFREASIDLLTNPLFLGANAATGSSPPQRRRAG